MKAQQRVVFCTSGNRISQSELQGKFCSTLSLPSTNEMLPQVLLKNFSDEVRNVYCVNASKKI